VAEVSSPNCWSTKAAYRKKKEKKLRNVWESATLVACAKLVVYYVVHEGSEGGVGRGGRGFTAKLLIHKGSLNKQGHIFG